jgi:dihydrolipoamide dehydrogenase
VVVATGSQAAVPPIDGLEEAQPWGNREATTAKRVPESLVVLGGGPVGCELSQAWRSLGAEVALVEAAERLLPNEEPFASAEVTDALRDAGVDVHAGTKAAAVRAKDGAVAVELEGGEIVRGAELLVAIGRKPRTEGIGLETVGVEPGGWLEVDELLRVGGREWLYAVGDVNGRALLTHMGKYQGRIAADRIIGREVGPVEDGNPPRVTFTDPNVAAVGLTLAKAKEEGLEARAVDVPTSGTAGASFHGRDAPGTARLVIDEERRVIVGATFVGAETAEWVHAATIAVAGAVPLDRLWHAVPAFPTRSEVWLKLMEEYGL